MDYKKKYLKYKLKYLNAKTLKGSNLFDFIEILIPVKHTSRKMDKYANMFY